MDTFVALADPTRRKILDMLAKRELSSGEIAQRFNMSNAAVSQHLKALREANLVHVRVDAQRRIYSFNPQGLDALRKLLYRLK